MPTGRVLNRVLPALDGLRPAWRLGVGALFALLVVGSVVHLAYVWFGWSAREDLATLIGNYVYNGVQLGCALLCFAAAASRAEKRGVWLILGVGVLCSAVGDVYWTVELSELEEPPYPSTADGLYLAFYPAAYATLLLLARRRLERMPASVWLDGLIGVLAVAAIGTAVLVAPVVAATEGDTAVVATNLAYPLADMLLIAFVVGMYGITGWRPGRAWLVIGVGLVFTALADGVYLFQEAAGTYEEGTLLDVGWPTGLLLVALSSWQEDRRGAIVRFEGWAVLVVPVVFALSAVAVLAYGNFAPVNGIAVLLASSTLVVAVARTALTFLDLRSLSESRREAATDELTGLANRRMFVRSLEQSLLASRRESRPVALLMADLDGFKELNDTLGHQAGDDLLREVARLLERSLTDGQMLARLGGDEFAVLVPGASEQAAIRAAGRLRESVSRAFPVHGLTVHVDASIGVSLFPDHGEDGPTLMQRADVAMYQAKEQRTGVEVYASERDRNSRHRLNLLGELPRGIAARELVLHYQPKCDLRTGAIAGVEALVRWQHPRLGLLPPGDFLPMAERTALMRPLTIEVLELALAQAARWSEAGHHVPIAVNLAVPNLLDSRLPADVSRLLTAAGVKADRLSLEITETSIMADPGRATRVLADIAALGVTISLDDFGAGHSSLAHLRWLPVSELKIDRAFVTDMAADPINAAIVRSTIDLGQRLGLRVVAEGVEDEATIDLLASLGCDLAQGFHLSRPLAARDLAERLEEGFHRPAPPGGVRPTAERS